MQETQSLHLNKLLELGIYHHQVGDVKKAYDYYWQILAEDLNHPDALHLSGLLAYDAGRLHIAKELMGKAISYHPEYPVYCNNYGLVLQSLEETETAIKYYQKALTGDPDYLDAAINLANLWVDEKNYRDALKLLKRTMRKFPESLDLLYALGSLYLKYDKKEKAVLFLNRVLEQDPRHTNALVYLGNLYQSITAWEKAIAYYEQAMQTDPTNKELSSELYHSIGTCVLPLGNLELAAQCFQAALDLVPNATSPKGKLAQIRYFKTFALNQRPLPMVRPQGNEAWDIILASACTLYEIGGGQHPPQITRALTQLGHRVLYLERFAGQTPTEPFEIYDDPFLLQQGPPNDFQHAQFLKIMQQFTNTSHNQKRLLLFTIFSPYLLEFIEPLKQLGYQMAYWCLDNWQGIGTKTLSAELENQLATQMDYLFATSDFLSEKMQRVTGKACPVISNGFSRANFPKIGTKPPLPEDMHLGKTKTFIYWGNLSAVWIHWDLLKEIAQRHPDWTFNLIGDVQDDTKKVEGPNIFYLGVKDVGELSPYGHHADIGFIHFKENPLINAVNPVKAYEYLACHLPIISTPMPELNKFPHAYQVRTCQAFEAAVSHIEQNPVDLKCVDDFIEKATWEQRALHFINGLTPH